MTRPLAPRVPAPPSAEPARPPLSLTPGTALVIAAMTALLSALLGSTFAPVKLGATTRVAAAHYSVQMANYAFAPASITVDEGDTITWTNQDTAPHTVTTTSGPERLSSPYLSKGQSWSYTFTAPGTYEYYCTVHPDMRAQVIVRAPAPTTAAAVRPPSSAPAVQAAVPAHVPSTPATPPSPAHSTRAAVAPPAPVTTPTVSGPPPSAAPLPAQQTADSSGIRTLSPILLLGGLTAAIAVFCLLMVGSRPAPDPVPAKASGAPGTRHEDDEYDY